MQSLERNATSQLAIIGMDLTLGNCDNLDDLERNIYETQKLDISTSNRAKKAVKEEDLRGAVQDIQINLLRFRGNKELEDNQSQHGLIFQVANNALRDAKLSQGANIAIIITAQQDNIDQSACTRIANDLCNLWGFTGRLYPLSAGENSVSKALEAAQRLLAAREVDAALVGEVASASSKAGEGAGAVVLKLLETAQQAQNRIYAQINAISIVQHPAASEGNNGTRSPNAETVKQTCQQAFQLAQAKPTAINYLEFSGSGLQQEDEAEIKGLLQAYRTPQSELSCAIGSIKANLKPADAAPEIASLIKTALCLYYCYIPGIPQWSGPRNPQLWQGSPFYAAVESRPWFAHTDLETKRFAALHSIDTNGIYAHLILSEDLTQKERPNKYLEQTPFYLFPIAADDRSTLLEQLHALQESITDGDSLSAIASQTFAAYQKHSQADYALVIIGRNQDQLLGEIERAFQGVANAFESAKDWQTPVGSYFTAHPLGKKGKVAYVYPGGFSTYIGIGRTLFRMFPSIYSNLVIQNVRSRVANIEKLLYPRSLAKLSKRQLENLEKQLIEDPLAMLESGMGISGLLSAILKDYFQLKPQGAFGYSLGEISMIFSQGVWEDFHQSSNALNLSSLFKTRLSGPKRAVREYWGLPEEEDDEGDFWSIYVLIADATKVREQLKSEKRVYLTQVNTPQEVVIAGDTQACQRVIESLKCGAFRAPFNHVIHCEAMRSEYDELVRLNTLPVKDRPDIVFYSAAEYQPVCIDSQSIAHNIAQAICQELDFPRLVNRVYQDGFKIFLEVGAGGNCSRWINEILQDKEHMTISLNRRGMDDHVSIFKALARLVSHRVELNLSPLYTQSQASVSSKFTVKTMAEENNYRNHNKPNFELSQELSGYSGNIKREESFISSSNLDRANSHHGVYPSLANLHSYQYQKLMSSASSVSKTHATFLKSRQEAIKVLSQMIQVQTTFLQNMTAQSQSKNQ